MDEYDPDVWQEDEDVVRDLMEFQDADPEFKMPFEIHDPSASNDRRSQNTGKIFLLFKIYNFFIDRKSSNLVLALSFTHTHTQKKLT